MTVNDLFAPLLLVERRAAKRTELYFAEREFTQAAIRFTREQRGLLDEQG